MNVLRRENEDIPWSEYEAYREVAARPSEFNEERFSLDIMWNAVQRAEILFRGWPFIFFDERYTRPHGEWLRSVVDLTDITGYDRFERWELHKSGLFFHKVVMEEETNPAWRSRGMFIDFVMTVYHIAEAVGSLWRLYEALGMADEEVVQFEFRYVGVKGRRVAVVADPSRAGIRGSYDCATDEVEHKRRAPLSVWRATDAEMASSIAIELFQQMGWMEPNREEISKIARNFLAKPRF